MVENRNAVARDAESTLALVPAVPQPLLPKTISLTERNEREVLNEMAVDLSKHLDIKTMSLYLLKHNLLNSNQQQQLLMEGQTKLDRAQKLLDIMKTNCSTPATRLLAVLQDMQQTEDSISPAHEELISTLTTKIAQFSIPPDVRQVARTRVRLPSPDSTYQSWEHISMPFPVNPHFPPPYLHRQLERRLTSSSEQLDNEQVACWCEKKTLQCISYERMSDPLDEDTFQLSQNYSKFCVDVADLLTRVSNIKKVHLYLSNELSSAKPRTYKFPNQQQIFELTDIYEVLQHLASHTCWFDYHLITGMCRILGGRKGEKLASGYEKKFESYVQMKSKTREDSIGKKIVEVKLAWNWDETSAEQIQKFTISFCRILKCSRESFKLIDLQRGCVLITWKVPEYLCPKISYYSTACSDLLDLLGVIWVIVAERKYTMKNYITRPVDANTVTNGSLLQQFTRSQSVPAINKERTGILTREANSLVSFRAASERVPSWEIAESENSSFFDFSQEAMSLISQSEQSVETAIIVEDMSTVSEEHLNRLSSQLEDYNNHTLATTSLESTDNTCKDNTVFTVTTEKELNVHTRDLQLVDTSSTRDTRGNQRNKYSQQHGVEEDKCVEVTQEGEPLSMESSMPAYPKYTDTWSSEYSSGYDTMHSNQNRKIYKRIKAPKSPLCSSSLSLSHLQEKKGSESSRKSFPSNLLSRSTSQSQSEMLPPDGLDMQSMISCSSPAPLLETVPLTLPSVEHINRNEKKPESAQDLLSYSQSEDEGFFSLNTRLESFASQTSFSGLILNQASKDMPAQLYMIAIDEYKTGQQDYLSVRQGQEFRVLFQEEDEVFAITREGQRGYIPLSLCHLSSKYLSEQNKRDIIYSRYSYSPNMPKGKPIMHGVATINFQASTPTELSVSAEERLSILVESSTWVYAVSSNKAGFIPRQVLKQQELEPDQRNGSQSFLLPHDPFSCSLPEISSNTTNTGTSYTCYNFFSKEVLSKASPQIPANLHMICIRDYKASRFDEVDVKTGQKVVAMLQDKNRVLIQVRNKQGFIPRSACHLTSHYTRSATKHVTVSRRRIVTNPTKAANGIVTQNHTAKDKLELSVNKNQEIFVLFRDNIWAYCVLNRHYSGFLPQSKIYMTRHPQSHIQRKLTITHDCIPSSHPSLRAGQEVYELLKTQYMVYVRTRNMKKLWVPVNAVRTSPKTPTSSGPVHLLQSRETINSSSLHSCPSTLSLETIGSHSLHP